jgi:hypothetical protein
MDEVKKPQLVHWPSDARHHTQRSYHGERRLVTQRPALAEDGSCYLSPDGKTVLELRLQTHPDTDVCPSNRLRTVSLSFTYTNSAKELTKRYEKSSDHLMTVGLNGDELLRCLAQAAHEPEAHRERFRLGFLVAAHLRETQFDGVASTAGACGAQLYVQTAEYRAARGQLVPVSDHDARRWIGCFKDHVFAVIRRADHKDGVHVPVVRPCPITIAPNSLEKYGPGQHVLYEAHHTTDAQLMRHLDCASLGLDNFLVHRYPNAVACVRAPVFVPPEAAEAESPLPPGVEQRQILECPDSLSWFVAQSLIALNRGSPAVLVEKAEKGARPENLTVARRDEISRWLQAQHEHRVFVPRSRLPLFEARQARRENLLLAMAGAGADEEIVGTIPVTPAVELKAAYARFKTDVMDRVRGVLDFTKGLQVSFWPVHPKAWLHALQTTTHELVQMTIKIDLVYCPLLDWLDTPQGGDSNDAEVSPPPKAVPNGKDDGIGSDDSDDDDEVVVGTGGVTADAAGAADAAANAHLAP